MTSQYTIDPFYDSPEWRDLRILVLNRDQSVCFYCHGEAHQVDHVKPRRRGGTDSVKNLVACCATCNKTAGNRLFKDRQAKQDWILKHRLPEEPRPLRHYPSKAQYPVKPKKEKSAFRLKLEQNAKKR